MLNHDLASVNCRNLSPVELVALRVQLNKTIRRDSLAVNSIPLMAPQHWARRWQSCHRAALASALRAYRKVLAVIESIIGPAPKFFRPRPATKADARIARLYRPAIKATASFVPLDDDEPVQAESPRTVAPTPAITMAELTRRTIQHFGYSAPAQTAPVIPGPSESPFMARFNAPRIQGRIIVAKPRKPSHDTNTFIGRYNSPRIMGRIVA